MNVCVFLQVMCTVTTEPETPAIDACEQPVGLTVTRPDADPVVCGAGQFPGNAKVATPPEAAPSVDARKVKRNVLPLAPAVTLPGLTIASPCPMDRPCPAAATLT